MKNTDYLRGALSTINEQIADLEKKKARLLEEIDGMVISDTSSGNSVAATEFQSSTTASPRIPAAVTTSETAATAARSEAPADTHILGSSYTKYQHFMTGRREPIAHPRVVFQGESGAYSEIACRKFFGEEINAKGLPNFAHTFMALADGKADYAVLPIENSSTGAIRQVYDLLESYNYFFVGETTVQIEHALMALPGTKLKDIRTVYSHEQGLFQCEKFLGEHPDMRPVAKADTAGSARIVAEKKDRTKAAICSPLAAKIYGLEVLKKRINTNAENTTRFIVISPKPELRPERDKICISLTTGHIAGALHDALTVFAVHGINLVRLESRPIPGHNWEYMFFIEFTGDLMDKEIDRVIHEIALIGTDLRVLGNFRSNL